MNETEKKLKQNADWYATHSMSKQQVEKLIADKLARALAYLDAQEKQTKPKKVR